MGNPFDFVSDILHPKKGLILDEMDEKEYNPYLTNKSLSYHLDCVMYANEMNSRSALPKKMQYDYLMGVIRSRKRPFSKWIKREEIEDLDTISRSFGLSTRKAKAALGILSPEQLTELRENLQVGGLKKAK